MPIKIYIHSTPLQKIFCRVPLQLNRHNPLITTTTMNERTKPSSSSVQIKSKSDPEALLNDLSSSLKSFQSTVRTWTSSSTLPLNNPSNAGGGDTGTMRQARLGLGAKAQRQVVAGDSVAANILLKNQLTGKSNPPINKNNYHQTTYKQNIKVTKVTAKKRGSDDEDSGKASLIKLRNKK